MAAPGQQQPSMDSYSADYHIGARMKIRRVRPLFMPPNSLSVWPLCLFSTAADLTRHTVKGMRKSTGATSGRASASRAFAKTPSGINSEKSHVY